MQNQSQGVSIIICCYNSALKISATLKHIFNQVVPSYLTIEIVLIDNNCTDQTVAIAIDVWQVSSKKIGLRVFKEQCPGLSAARRSGVNEAQYECIIFCDDDNWLDTYYVLKAVQIIGSNEFIGAAGGCGTVYADINLPSWWEEYATGYAVGRQAINTGDISKRKYLWGAGLVSRRSLLIKVFDNKFPSLLSDRKGEELSSGGDSEICARILLLGYKLFFSEELKFVHYMDAGRLTEEYRDKMFAGHTAAFNTLRKYHAMIDWYGFSLIHKVSEIFKGSAKILNYYLKKVIDKTAVNTQGNAPWKVQFFPPDKDYKIIVAFKRRLGLK